MDGLQDSLNQRRHADFVGILVIWISDHVGEGATIRVPDQGDGVPCLARLGGSRYCTISREDNLRVVARDEALRHVEVSQVTLSTSIGTET